MLNYIKKTHKEKLFFIVLTILSVLATISVYVFKFNAPPIRSDGIGYYAYLPAIFLHKDISMKSLMDERAAKYNQATPESWSGITLQHNGNYLDKYTIGEAVLILPFFIPAHVLSVLFNQDLNGFTIFYQVFAAFSGTFYMVIGVFILKRFLDKYFKTRTVYLTLISIIFGTNLFHYGTYDSIFSHAYSFFLFACFLYLLPLWFEKTKDYRYPFLLGLVSGLIILVRPTNIILPIIFFSLYNIHFNILFKDLKEKISVLIKLWRNFFLMIFVSFLVLIPQFIYWKVITGNFLIFSYHGEGFDFTHLETLNVLFSIRKGLFFWSPILIFGILGIGLLKNKLKGWMLGVIIFLIINCLIISSWSSWYYGGGFGHRAFIESLAVLAIPLAAFFEKILAMKNKRLRYLILLITALLVILSIYTTFKYWDGSISIDGTTLGTYFKIFGIYK
ncbi:MAG: hypothetical protein ABI721_03655 [Candidatus Dojkabacteria bacterium]